ncbi:MAG TPA: hypothetical protein VF823_03900, partial [Anaerolineales bacterium]
VWYRTQVPRDEDIQLHNNTSRPQCGTVRSYLAGQDLFDGAQSLACMPYAGFFSPFSRFREKAGTNHRARG